MPQIVCLNHSDQISSVALTCDHKDDHGSIAAEYLRHLTRPPSSFVLALESATELVLLCRSVIITNVLDNVTIKHVEILESMHPAQRLVPLVDGIRYFLLDSQVKEHLPEGAVDLRVPSYVFDGGESIIDFGRVRHIPMW